MRVVDRRFIVTGTGRSGTRYFSELLTACGIRCGHERVFGPSLSDVDWQDWEADSSWMAIPHLHAETAPVVLVARHPLSVVKSWVEIGFFTKHDRRNPCHDVLRGFAPEVYEWADPWNRALEMWIQLNKVALSYAELVFRLEEFGPSRLNRLLRWAERDTDGAEAAYRRVAQSTNHHTRLRRQLRLDHESSWSVHHEQLAEEAQYLARLLGYGEEPPDA